MTMTTRQSEIRAMAQKAGFRYIGPEEFQQILNAADDPLPTSRPAEPLEPLPLEFAGRHQDILVNRYSLTPGPDYVRQLMPGATFATAPPQMFTSGPLPIITGSGLDPDLLRNVPWRLRHSAALSPSRAHVLQIIETGDEHLQTREGHDALRAYMGEVRRWAATPPPPEPLTDDEIATLFPPGKRLNA
jgi:hypothetical protein